MKTMQHIRQKWVSGSRSAGSMMGLHLRHPRSQGVGPHSDHLSKQVAVHGVAVPTTAPPALEVHGKLVARSQWDAVLGIVQPCAKMVRHGPDVGEVAGPAVVPASGRY